MTKSLKRFIQLSNANIYQTSDNKRNGSSFFIIVIFILICVYCYYNWESVLKVVSNLFK